MRPVSPPLGPVNFLTGPMHQGYCHCQFIDRSNASRAMVHGPCLFILGARLSIQNQS